MREGVLPISLEELIRKARNNQRPNELTLTQLRNALAQSKKTKQKIYSVHSILYHIRNIDSVFSTQNLVKYNYINILLDEIGCTYYRECLIISTRDSYK